MSSDMSILEARMVRVRACVRRHTQDGVSLPPPPKGKEAVEAVREIREELPGWVVAKPKGIYP